MSTDHAARLVNLALDQIRIDGGTQPRAKIDMEVVNDYSTSFELGADFPPIDVFFDGTEYWLADGFHRYHAARDAHIPELPTTIHNGTVRDAILFSYGCNDRHGLRRTNEDKWHIVTSMVLDEEWSKWSDRSIAEKCGVSNRFVGMVREKVCTVHTFSKPTEVKYTTSTGKTATMQVQPPKPRTITESAPIASPDEQYQAPDSAKDDVPPNDVNTPDVDEPSTGWTIHDDVSRLRALIAKLHNNWVTEEDRSLIAQFFRQCADEV